MDEKYYLRIQSYLQEVSRSLAAYPDLLTPYAQAIRCVFCLTE